MKLIMMKDFMHKVSTVVASYVYTSYTHTHTVPTEYITVYNT